MARTHSYSLVASPVEDLHTLFVVVRVVVFFLGDLFRWQDFATFAVTSL